MALASFMRLSLKKAAHVDVGGAPWRKSGYVGRKRRGEAPTIAFAECDHRSCHGPWPIQVDEKRLGPATTLYGTAALSFVIPSAAERLQFRGPFLEMFFDRASGEICGFFLGRNPFPIW